MSWFRLMGLRSYEEQVEQCRQADALEHMPYTGKKRAYTKDKLVEAAERRRQRSQEWLTVEENMHKELEEQQFE